MKSALFLTLLLGTLALAQPPLSPEGKPLEQSATPVLIAADGEAKLAITVAPDASPTLRQTARALQDLLQRITGAALSIESGSTPAGITLGLLTQFPDASLTQSLAIQHGYDGVEAYAIRTDASGIRLLGNTELGASHAAYRFLELLGYRHFFMGPNWEVVPRIATLRFDLNEVNRPRIWSRTLGFTRMKTVGEPGDPDRLELVQQWRRAVRLAESLDVTTRHTWHAIPDSFRGDQYPFRAEFVAHPEYFALVDGQRKGPQLCVSNPGLQKVVVAYARHYLDRAPTDDMVSLDPADTAGWCTCDTCAKLGSPSVQPFYLANLVARELQQSHPGKYVGLLAYSWHSDPPDFVLEPNVFVQLTAGMNASKLSFDELLEAWSAKCGRLGVYEYYSYWEMDQGMLPGGGPQVRHDEMPARMQRLIDHGVIALTAEASVNFGVHGLPYYLAHKLMWDPTADPTALKRDFCASAFGPAAEPMLRYYERFNLSSHPLRGLVMLRAAANDLHEAGLLASGQPQALARINDLKAYMVYNALGLEVESTGDYLKKHAAALAWFTWAYRIRNTFLIDWPTFRAAVGNHEYKPTLAARFKEPTWNYRVTKDNPWRNDEPLTAPEIEERFEQVCQQWGPMPVVEPRTFAGPYVVVANGGGAVTDQELGFLNRGALLLASVQGEPLEFVLVSSPSPQLERQDMEYILSTQAGQVLHQADIPEGDNALQLPVPAPGVYRLNCKRGGKGWSIKLPAKLPAAVIMDDDLDNRPQNMTGWFYVPQGTRQLGVHAQWGLTTLRDPSNAVALKENMRGDLHAVNVPAGMDGRAWSFYGKVRNLWFINAPTALAVEPTRLFVPRELAQQDRLKIIVP